MRDAASEPDAARVPAAHQRPTGVHRREALAQMHVLSDVKLIVIMDEQERPRLTEHSEDGEKKKNGNERPTCQPIEHAHIIPVFSPREDSPL